MKKLFITATASIVLAACGAGGPLAVNPQGGSGQTIVKGAFPCGPKGQTCPFLVHDGKEKDAAKWDVRIAKDEITLRTEHGNVRAFEGQKLRAAVNKLAVERQGQAIEAVLPDLLKVIGGL